MLELYSQPILLIGGWITAAFAMTFCVLYFVTPLSILALFYLMIGCGLLLFTFLAPPKALTGIIFLSVLSLIFLGIFSIFVNITIFWFGALIIAGTLILSIIMAGYRIRLLPTPIQIGLPPEAPRQPAQPRRYPTF